ncbi:PspC domain-containing protein [Roseateles oligotrophus]|uniref:PspC domain-containing protein n=1 Tax=Roseateles oligotrophus TaxID=1769250 RepID=A0ABT2YCR2_9BURK|nr:PspC domain-containing protein [Roseateles oligotrophus]MCV2367838.1 PspC domain-containing protein [Roseateles oligotrophus]
MSLSNEFERLADLHDAGQLSDDEFSRAKARLLDGQASMSGRESPPLRGAGLGHAINGLQRSRDERWLGGVCGGLAQISGLAAWIWRLIFIAAVPCHGIGLMAYLILWVLVPEERNEPLRLR